MTHADPAPAAARFEKFCDLVCEGGGVRGIALVGAMSVLEERGFEIQNLAGTSAGAIVATLRAAGSTGAELKEIIAGLDFRRFMDVSAEDRIPVAGQALSILLDQGIYEGNYFLNLMRDLLARKNIHTFRDLVHPVYADDPKYRYRVQVIASDITGRCLLSLPNDATKLGIQPDDLEVALAVRMSMSIPIFFEPVRFTNPQSGRDHLIVDGGLLSNFPVWIFDSAGTPAWPTFGLWLGEADPKQALSEALPPPSPSQNAIAVLVDYLKNIVYTAVEAHDRLYIEQENFVRTVVIPTLGVDSVNFGLPRDQIDALYQSGRDSATKFLSTWDFDAYVAEFRSGRTHSRRADVVAKLRSTEVLT